MRYIEAPTEYLDRGVSVFLAGGISGAEDWQQRMTQLLADADITVLNPRRERFPQNDPGESERQIEWEHRHIRRATIRLFWFPPQTDCPISLYELGAASMMPGPLLVGTHPNFSRRFDVIVQTRLVRPEVKVADTLETLAGEVRRLSHELQPKELTR